MIQRLQRSIDFERVLKTRSRASSVHFAVHHLDLQPARRSGRAPGSAAVAADGDLSTDGAAEAQPVVDGAPRVAPAVAGSDVWLGAVVPKRHARRAVTRTLLKRQIRNVASDGADLLARGLWVVRLRAPFDRSQFPSAASDALRRLARAELQQVIASAVERLQRR